MPLYEYECEACGNRFERIQKFSDPLVDTCPACSGTVRKLLSSPAIQFKGSGWYITDYARKSSGDGAGGKDSKDSKDRTDSKDAKDTGKKEGAAASSDSSASSPTKTE
jgi:putative FmdB family regulatory protein